MKPVVASSRFQHLLVRIHSSLWFVPTLVVLSMILLALGLVEFDRHFVDTLSARWPRLFETRAEGARSMLSAIAGSMATIAGVVFSITMVALALASNQYTSRVLRNFMRDRANQIVLGIFIGVHLYCLFVLRAVSGHDGGFVPSSAVLGALVLALLASGAFIFFVHHISSTIQASDMAAAITRETLQTIDRLFPDPADDGVTPAAALPSEATTWQAVPAQQWGSVQTIAGDQLVAFARKHDVVVRMECKPGDFIGMHQPIVSLAMDSAPDHAMIAELNRAFGLGDYRTIDQDPAFGIRQLVDISLKALSPGINDTTTAVTCIEHIGLILSHCGNRNMTAQHHVDGNTLRVLRISNDAARLVDLAFSQITENAEGNTEILLRLLDTMQKVAASCDAPAVHDALRRQAEVAGEIAVRGARSHTARARLDEKLHSVRAQLAPDAAHLRVRLRR